jgi:prepilin-type N-terminal cleavage/methylation domain-containing protein
MQAESWHERCSLELMKTVRRSPGFTLIEIMIVVAIIAMIATIAIPNFLRARKRAQATRMMDDLRLIDNALDRYAADNSKAGGAPASWEDLQPYLKKNIVLYNSNGIDLFGNPINDGPLFLVDSLPKVNSTSFSSLSDVAPRDFWVPFDP